MKNTYLYNKKYSNIGENIAINYLIRKNYKIIAKNFRINQYEIDIIANIREFLVFFEVKTRLSKKYESAEYQFSRKKLSNLKKAIKKYCYINNLNEEKAKIEFIAIDIDNSDKLANIKHFSLVT